MHICSFYYAQQRHVLELMLRRNTVLKCAFVVLLFHLTHLNITFSVLFDHMMTYCNYMWNDCVDMVLKAIYFRKVIYPKYIDCEDHMNNI